MTYAQWYTINVIAQQLPPVTLIVGRAHGALRAR